MCCPNNFHGFMSNAAFGNLSFLIACVYSSYNVRDRLRFVLHHSQPIAETLCSLEDLQTGAKTGESMGKTGAWGKEKIEFIYILFCLLHWISDAVGGCAPGTCPVYLQIKDDSGDQRIILYTYKDRPSHVIHTCSLPVCETPAHTLLNNTRSVVLNRQRECPGVLSCYYK